MMKKDLKTMKRRMNVFSILTVIAMMFVMLGTATTRADAATKGWSLSYAKGSPSNLTVTSRTVSGIMSSTKKVSANVSSFRGSDNAWVRLATSHGKMSVFVDSKITVKTQDKVKKGTRVTGTAVITKPSAITNCYATGSFSF